MNDIQKSHSERLIKVLEFSRLFSKPSFNRGKNTALRHVHGIPAMSCVSGPPRSHPPSSVLQTKQTKSAKVSAAACRGPTATLPKSPLLVPSSCSFRESHQAVLHSAVEVPPGEGVPFSVSASLRTATARHFQSLIALDIVGL